MKYILQVKPNSRHEKVELLPDGSLKVHVNAPAHEGRANDAVIALLARHFKVPKSSITILHGSAGRRKVVEII
ncbi:MAG: hypothetical protein COV45_01570 [Deltaproteobacteria bacterium CG11_big_fil_rev_8_21_14_0_20_47_16]|nr:MAG: hypothetical protein COV45_01570 [Deltaproteobacteria bacterium CG11_big_fil_rev_8_21_14_0_20_47_16]